MWAPAFSPLHCNRQNTMLWRGLTKWVHGILRHRVRAVRSVLMWEEMKGKICTNSAAVSPETKPSLRFLDKRSILSFGLWGRRPSHLRQVIRAPYGLHLAFTMLVSLIRHFHRKCQIAARSRPMWFLTVTPSAAPTSTESYPATRLRESCPWLQIAIASTYE